ncbi:hypothetical protein OIU76_021594 [Salix suchowensis]|nr:hypothetical protein OIU76_021594 [Salix suchowensis]
MKKAQVVLVPSPGIGHLVPAIEFAKRLLDQDDSFLITVLVIIKAPFGPDTDTCNQSMLTTIDTPIQYITLPKVTPPDLDPLTSPENYYTTFMEAHKPLVRDAVVNQVMSIKPAVPVVGLVVDLFCASMIDVANELGISSYVYFASSAAFLGLLLYLPTRQEQAGIEFKETDPDLIVSLFCQSCACQELESHAVRSFSGGGTPPVYTVGPLVNVNGHSLMGSNLDRHGKILEWLDDQREKSVVFSVLRKYRAFEGSPGERNCTRAGTEWPQILMVHPMRSNNLVMADKIAKSVECVMEEDREVRNRVKAMSEASRKAVMEGGSSFSAIGDLIKDMLS